MCIRDSVCSNGLVYFFSTLLFTTGVCQEPIEDGQPCVPGEGPSCRSNRCDKATNTCRVTGEQPPICNADNACVYGYRCVSSTGACVPYAAAGEPCASGDCSSFLGLTCASSGTCVPIKSPGPGSACEFLSTCQEGSYCQGSFLGGTCVSQLEAGQACSSAGIGGLPNLQSSCRYPLVCVGAEGSQTCELPEI